MLPDLLRQLYAGSVKVQLRRFVIVGMLAAVIQMALWGFVDVTGRNYLFGAVVAIEATIIFQYVLNNHWTFQHCQNTGTTEYITGLLKTTIVRGTAIPDDEPDVAGVEGAPLDTQQGEWSNDFFHYVFYV